MARTPFYLTEDLDVFFEDFGEDCYVNNTCIVCLFTENPGSITSWVQDVTGTIISVHLKNVDIDNNNIKNKTPLTIRNTKFLVLETKRNGSGISVLRLEKYKE